MYFDYLINLKSLIQTKTNILNIKNIQTFIKKDSLNFITKIDLDEMYEKNVLKIKKFRC